MIAYEQQLDSDWDLALREGSMYFEGANKVHKTLHRIAQRLKELDVDYAIAGGMCLYRHGFYRFTQDVDIIVTRDALHIIHEALEGRGYIRPFEASKNLRDADTGVRIDFIISGQYPGEGTPGPISFPIPKDASIEIDGIHYLDIVSLIELKLASGQASHRAQDLHDVQQLIQARALPRELVDQLDPSVREAYLRKWNDAQRAARDDY